MSWSQIVLGDRKRTEVCPAHGVIWEYGSADPWLALMSHSTWPDRRVRSCANIPNRWQSRRSLQQRRDALREAKRGRGSKRGHTFSALPYLELALPSVWSDGLRASEPEVHSFIH
jgi:hypothetical protein